MLSVIFEHTATVVADEETERYGFSYLSQNQRLESNWPFSLSEEVSCSFIVRCNTGNVAEVARWWWLCYVLRHFVCVGKKVK
jgi:hypothetical protein